MCYIELLTVAFFFFFDFKVVVLSPDLYPFINTAVHSFGDKFSMINTVVGVLNIFCFFVTEHHIEANKLNRIYQVSNVI